MTYGSQLRALYGRIFPSVLGPAVLGYAPTDGTPTFGDPHPDVPGEGVSQVRPPGLARPTLCDLLGTGGWVNLFRRADSLGWRVFSDDDSDHDVCTPEVPPRAAGDPGPTVSAQRLPAHHRVPPRRRRVARGAPRGGERLVHLRGPAAAGTVNRPLSDKGRQHRGCFSRWCGR